LPVLIFGHSDLNFLRKRSPFDANSIFLDAWLKDLSTYQIASENKLIWERYDFSKTTYKSVSRHVLCRNKSNLLKCRLFTLKRTIFIFFGRIQTDWRDVGIRVSYQIKRKRKKRRGRPKRKRKLHPFLYTWNYVLIYFIN
jgi:hypothetical protein